MLRYPHMNTSYADGYWAFGEGLELSDNPHEDNTDDHAAWIQGWTDAQDDA